MKNLSGYVFLVFEKESQVEKLLMQCYTENGRHYLLLSSPTVRDKPVGIMGGLAVPAPLNLHCFRSKSARG